MDSTNRPPRWETVAGRVPFRLGVVADEISQDLARALDVARELGADEVELNTLWGKPVTDLDADETRLVDEMVRARGLRVGVVLASTLKAHLVEDWPLAGAVGGEDHARHLEVFRRSIDLAHRLGAERVRVFSFRRPEMRGLGNPSPRHPRGGPLDGATLERIGEALRQLCAVAEREGVLLCLENVRSCYGDSGWNARRILDAVGSPRLRLIWDPANAFVSGEENGPAAYDHVRSDVVDVHLKDARVVDAATGLTAWERVGAGEVSLREQLRALIRDGYSGTVTLETHWRLPGDDGEASTRATFEGLVELVEGLLAAS